ncbi:hypothetical protein Hanom_Chr15g01351321 [Helianthus anomalus]
MQKVQVIYAGTHLTTSSAHCRSLLSTPISEKRTHQDHFMRFRAHHPRIALPDAISSACRAHHALCAHFKTKYESILNSISTTINNITPHFYNK